MTLVFCSLFQKVGICRVCLCNQGPNPKVLLVVMKPHFSNEECKWALSGRIIPVYSALVRSIQLGVCCGVLYVPDHAFHVYARVVSFNNWIRGNL